MKRVPQLKRQVPILPRPPRSLICSQGDVAQELYDSSDCGRWECGPGDEGDECLARAHGDPHDSGGRGVVALEGELVGSQSSTAAGIPGDRTR